MAVYAARPAEDAFWVGSDRRGDAVMRHLALVLVAATLAITVAGAEEPAHLVPSALIDGVLLNVPQRRMFLMENGGAVASYPVGLGRPSWPTFIGAFIIAVKEEDPVWDVPPSIQEEMRRAGKPVLTRVGPGPANPLGRYWLGLSVPGFGIHGTNAPNSILRFESHGCIRLLAGDIEDLFSRVEVGTPGLSIYEPVVLKLIDDALWIEAHPDVYRRGPANPVADVLERVAHLAPDAPIDERAIDMVLRQRDGRPRRMVPAGR